MGPLEGRRSQQALWVRRSTPAEPHFPPLLCTSCLNSEPPTLRSREENMMRRVHDTPAGCTTTTLQRTRITATESTDLLQRKTLHESLTTQGSQGSPANWHESNSTAAAPEVRPSDASQTRRPGMLGTEVTAPVKLLPASAHSQNLLSHAPLLSFLEEGVTAHSTKREEHCVRNLVALENSATDAHPYRSLRRPGCPACQLLQGTHGAAQGSSTPGRVAARNRPAFATRQRTRSMAIHGMATGARKNVSAAKQVTSTDSGLRICVRSGRGGVSPLHQRAPLSP